VTTPPPAELTMLDLGKVVDIVAQALQDENEPRSIARRSGINDPRLPSGSTQSLDRWEPVFRAALEGSPETLAVLRDPETYSSVTGGSRPFGGTLLQDLAVAGQVLNMMDDPRHSQIRRLVSSGLTPRMIRPSRMSSIASLSWSRP